MDDLLVTLLLILVATWSPTDRAELMMVQVDDIHPHQRYIRVLVMEHIRIHRRVYAILLRLMCLRLGCDC